MHLIYFNGQRPKSVFKRFFSSRWGFYLVAMTFIFSCTPKSCERKKVVPEPTVTVVTKPKKTKEQYDQELKDATRIRILVQALAIEQAAWKVLLEKQEGDVTSVFYPVVRAFGKNQARVPVPTGKNICDQFVIQSNGPTSEISMACRTGAKSFATYQESAGLITVAFHNKELGDIIGLGPSLTAKDANCKLTAEKNVLLRMECKGLSRSRGEQEVVNLKSLTYIATAPELLKLEGQVLRNLIPVSHINMNVPVAGAIAVTETWLPPLPSMDDVQSEEPVAADVNPKPKTNDEQYEVDGAGQPINPEVPAEAAANIKTVPAPQTKPTSGPQIEVDAGSVRTDGPMPDQVPYDEGIPSIEETGRPDRQ